MDFKSLENSSFESFDPDFYDPAADSYDQPQKAPRKASKAYFDLVMTNPEAGVKTVELFNFLRSFTRMQRADFIGANVLYGYQPLATREGIEALINNVVPVGNRTPANESNTSDAGFVGFDKSGSLIITPSGVYNTGTILKVSCSQFPYSGLLESSNRYPFVITRIRMTTTTDAQISNPIVLFRNNFLGSKSQNEVNPRNFFNPNQFQTKIIDIPVDFKVHANSGMLYNLNGGETVQWNVEIEDYNMEN